MKNFAQIPNVVGYFGVFHPESKTPNMPLAIFKYFDWAVGWSRNTYGANFRHDIREIANEEQIFQCDHCGRSERLSLWHHVTITANIPTLHLIVCRYCLQGRRV